MKTLKESTAIYHPFPRTRVAAFLDRPNRFLVRCSLDGRRVSAFLPNPGRLKELLLPGRPVHLVEEQPQPKRRTRYTAVAVEREDCPVMLHTHRTNDVARRLVERGLVPGLEGASVTAEEVRRGRSRFDLLLQLPGGRGMLLEVKSCTLAGRKVAMFPDAVTERGTRHVRDLAELATDRTRCGILFVVHWPEAELFMPDFHTDPAFARALLDCRDRVEAIALAVRWDRRLGLLPEARRLRVPWETIEREARDRGSYLVLLRLGRTRRIAIGSLGPVLFPKGFYIYVGSAMRGLSRRLARHRRSRKMRHWHMDWFRPHAELVDLLPVRSSERLECRLARAVDRISGWSVPGFGCSDCRCASHLYGFGRNPLQEQAFHDLLAWYRMDRLAAGPRAPAGRNGSW